MDHGHFVIHNSVKKIYASLFVLHEIDADSELFLEEYEQHYEVLKPLVDYIFERSYLRSVESGLELTPVGSRYLASFKDRYQEFLHEYDIFCGVDLEAGEFAVSYVQQFTDSSEWGDFLNQDKWEDLRIAVAEYRGFDAMEIVFMSFVQDGRFGRSHSGWHEELLTGCIWEEIQLICNNAIRLKSLGREKNGLWLSGELVMQEILGQAKKIKASLQTRIS